MMKNCRLSYVSKHLSVLAAFVTLSTIELCGSPLRDDDYDKLFEQVLTSWAEGLSASELAVTEIVVEDVLARDDTNRMLGARLLDELLLTESPMGARGDEDIALIKSSGLHLMASTELSHEAARRNSLLASELVGYLRRQIIPEFAHLSVTSNLAPPPGVSGFAGMSPKAISDPDARARYESAIRDNSRRNKINRRQRRLGIVERIVVVQLRQYLVKLAQQEQISHDDLDQCLVEAGFEEWERKELLDRINSY